MKRGKIGPGYYWWPTGSRIYGLSIGAQNNDLEWPWMDIERSVSKHMRLSEPTTKIRMNPCPMTRFWQYKVDADIRGVPSRGCVKQQWGNRKRCFRTLRLRHLKKWSQNYYIVPCRLSTDPIIYDLEWPLYVQFSIFTITNRVWAIRLHIYRRTIYRIFLLYDVPAEMCGRGPWKPWSA